MGDDDLPTISALLDEKRVIEPPPGFRAQAVVTSDEIYKRAEKDFEGFWAGEAAGLQWARLWDRVLDWDDPPWVKWIWSELQRRIG
jgi:acetyl-CoA synthetase